MWIIVEEPVREAYNMLIDYAAEVCEEFTLVQRDDDLNEKAAYVLYKLIDNLIEVKEQQSWPGTELRDSSAHVYYYRLNQITKEILKNHASSLYSWIEPNLLEDLSFFKKDRKPWLITISHEQFGWIDNFTSDEISTLILQKGIPMEEQ